MTRPVIEPPKSNEPPFNLRMTSVKGRAASDSGRSANQASERLT